MSEGIVPSKGTRIFFGYSPGASSSDSDGVVVLQVTCPTNIPEMSEGETPRVDVTCLSSFTKDYVDGQADPPTIAIPVNFIPRSEAHQALINAKRLGSSLVLPWMFVLPDQTAAPTTVDSDGYLVSPGPTSIGLKGYVTNFTVGASVGDVWKGTLTIQPKFYEGHEGLDWDFPVADLP